jgi:hypothetical protein
MSATLKKLQMIYLRVAFGIMTLEVNSGQPESLIALATIFK